jgi:hypothetical protein
MEFVHVLTTRFNVRAREDSPPASDAWLRDRLALFDRFTVATIRTQTVRPDAWLVFLDAASPDWFVSEIKRRMPDGGFTPVWLDGVFGPDAVVSAIREAGLDAAEYLVTTRVDNDDAVGRRFIETIQSAVSPRAGRYFINLSHGAQYGGEAIYRCTDLSNAFITCVEGPTVERRSVWIDQHGHLVLHGDLVQVRCPPLWLQIVHGANLGNSLTGIRSEPKSVLKAFDLQLGVESMSRPRAMLAGTRRGLRFCRRATRARFQRLLGIELYDMTR